MANTPRFITACTCICIVLSVFFVSLEKVEASHNYGGGSSGNVSGVDGASSWSTGQTSWVSSNGGERISIGRDFNGDGDMRDANEWVEMNVSDGGSNIRPSRGSSGSGCSGTQPDLRVTNIAFSRPGGAYGSVSPDKLEVGLDYEAHVEIRNVGCRSTTDGSNHKDEMPFGADGTFPVGLEVDFNRNGVDYREAVAAQGPLAPGQTIRVRLPQFTAASAGTHSATAFVDTLRSRFTVSCSGAFGCIDEPGDETNSYSRTMRGYRPFVTLGTYLWTDTGGAVARGSLYGNEHGHFRDGSVDIGSRWGRTTSDVSRGNINQLGIYWNGGWGDDATIRGGECTGTVVDSGGSNLPDFVGSAPNSQRYPMTTEGKVSRGRIDSTVPDPAPGSYLVFSIDCRTIGGGTISDSIVVSNGASIASVVLLRPVVNTVRLYTGERLTSLPFTVQNTGPSNVSNFTYTINIGGGSNEGSGTGPGINSGASTNVTGSLSYTAPSTPTTVPLTVCVSHPNMPRAQCDSASVVVAAAPLPECSDGPANDNDGDGYSDRDDPGCHSDGDATTPGGYTPGDDNEGGNPPPTISADPEVIRQGGDTTISWNPAGYPRCTITPTSIFPTAPNLNRSGSATVTLTTQTRVTITCGNLSDSIDIRVIPNIFET